MTKLILLVVLVVALLGLALAVLSVLQKPKSGTDPHKDDEQAPEGPPPYEKKNALLSDAELRFLAVLEPAVAATFGPEARISFQVPVGAVMQVKRGLDRAESQRWRNKVDRKTLDFVVTDARTKVLACVELDDSSHAQAGRQERDAFLERACAAAGVRLMRVAGRQIYDPESVARALAAES